MRKLIAGIAKRINLINLFLSKIKK